MKNRIAVSLVNIIIGILLYLIPTYLFPVCDSSEMKMACYYTKQAEIGLAIVITLLGVIAILIKNSYIRAGINLAELVIGAIIFLYPLKLIGLCKMSNMACRLKTLPAWIIAGIFLIVLSIGNLLYLIRKEKVANAKQ